MFKVGEEVVFVVDDPYKAYRVGDRVIVTAMFDGDTTLQVIDQKGSCANFDRDYFVLASEYSAAENLKEQTALDIQHGGQHYKGMKIQPVEFIHANNIGYMEGNAIKYLCRWQMKNGLEDLNKAKHYIELLIEMETASESKD